MNRSAVNGSPGLGDLLEEFAGRLEVGEALDVAAFAAAHPEHEEQLRRVLPTMLVLADLGRSASAGGAAPPSAGAGAEPASGVLGDFRIIREVGRGGMGVVYEAEQVSLGRRVALKVLPFAATMDPRHLQRFHNEARAAAGLHHPNIVPVYAVGQERAVHFYAMQLIEGQTLAAMIQDLRQRGGQPPLPDPRPTAPHVPGAPAPSAADTAERAAASTERAPTDAAYFRRVAELGMQAAEALEHAHQLGIVHRDVKPANLMVDVRGNLWVTDFGLAQVQSDTRVTMTGDLVGTLRYMSPEQALAKRVVVDHRTDVYSLGVTLYELLTREPAFTGNDRQELLRQIAFEEPKSPRRLNRAIPAELETIVLKATEKNPAERYATAQELADDLRRFLTDEPIQARRAGVARRLRKWGRRHPAAVAAVGAALVATLIVLSAGVGWVASDRATRQEATATEVRKALDESAEWQQRRRVPEALSAARRARGALAGGHADAALRRQVEARVDDLDLLAGLEEARLEGTAVKGNHFDIALCLRRYGEILREAKLDVEAQPAEEVGERIRGSTVAVELAAVLDNWAILHGEFGPRDDITWKHLLQVARKADGDAWRTRLREALERNDREALVELASSDEATHLLPSTLVVLGRILRSSGAIEQAESLLRVGQRHHPDDFWSNQDLALFLIDSDPPRHVEAIPYLMAAVALRPQSPGAHGNLGLALWAKGDLDGAIAEHKEAIRLKKDDATAHSDLGVALHAKGDVDGAIAEYKEAIRLKKDHANAHTNLGFALKAKGDVDGAIAEHKEAIRLNRNLAVAHFNLGLALYDKGDVDGAIAKFKEAIRLKKDDAKPHYSLGNALVTQGVGGGWVRGDAASHYSLGNALLTQGDADGAIAEYKEAIRLKEDYAEPHCNLGHSLRDKGQFAEALTHLRRGHELGSKNPRWPYPSAQWVKRCERLVQLDGKLPAILSGKEQPEDIDERVEYADVCQKKQLYSSAARLYRAAIMAKPDLMASPGNGLRYNAACAAALAGCGAGEDAAKLAGAERAGLRKQALDWLGADLAAWRLVLEKQPDKARPAVAQTMQHWLSDPDFNGVRGPEALAKLPEAERKEWQKLWQEVEALRKQAAGPK